MPKPHRRQAAWPPRVSIPPSVALPRPCVEMPLEGVLVGCCTKGKATLRRSSTKGKATPLVCRASRTPRRVPCRSLIAAKQRGHPECPSECRSSIQTPPGYRPGPMGGLLVHQEPNLYFQPATPTIFVFSGPDVNLICISCQGSGPIETSPRGHGAPEGGLTTYLPPDTARPNPKIQASIFLWRAHMGDFSMASYHDICPSSISYHMTFDMSYDMI